ncbi:MAG: lytic transglycosylase domain-containing protein [Burkholderiales bacterium]|nr:lytic transglycosylase domain-containing protein [Burkholderiales bacterium]
MFDIPVYIKACAPNVAVSTMQAIIKTESKGNPLAININKGFKLKFQPKNLEQAKSWVNYLEKHGYNFDVGIAQVNIKNLHKYGYGAVNGLDVCINLKIASSILQNNYNSALIVSNSSNEALQKAISAYNTGNYHSGFSNGYVRKVYRNAFNNKELPPIINANYIQEHNVSKKINKTILFVREDSNSSVQNME